MKEIAEAKEKESMCSDHGKKKGIAKLWTKFAV